MAVPAVICAAVATVSFITPDRKCRAVRPDVTSTPLASVAPTLLPRNSAYRVRLSEVRHPSIASLDHPLKPHTLGPAGALAPSLNLNMRMKWLVNTRTQSSVTRILLTNRRMPVSSMRLDQMTAIVVAFRQVIRATCSPSPST